MATVLATARVTVLEPAVVPVAAVVGIVAGEKVAVMPVGSPLADKATVELNPFCGVAETVV